MGSKSKTQPSSSKKKSNETRIVTVGGTDFFFDQSILKRPASRAAGAVFKREYAEALAEIESMQGATQRVEAKIRILEKKLEDASTVESVDAICDELDRHRGELSKLRSTLDTDAPMDRVLDAMAGLFATMVVGGEERQTMFIEAVKEHVCTIEALTELMAESDVDDPFSITDTNDANDAGVLGVPLGSTE